MSNLDLVLAVVSDTHCGSFTGLSTPSWELHGKNKLLASEAQEWLYNCWTDYWKYVEDLCFQEGKRIRDLIISHAGDCIDGFHHNTVQAFPDIYDQENLFVSLMEPCLQLANKGIYIAKGTPVHAGEAGISEERILERFKSEFKNSIDGGKDNIKADYKFLLVHNDYSVDIAHHGRASRRPWTSAGSNMISETIIEYYKEGLKPPRLLLRGHNHTIDDSGIKIKNSRYIALPSWQLRTHFGYKVASSQLVSDIGGLVVNMTAEFVDTSKIRYDIDNPICVVEV